MFGQRTVLTVMTASVLSGATASAQAQAQDKPRPGIVLGMSPGATLGFVLPAGTHATIRPEVSFQTNSSEPTGSNTTTTKSENHTVSVGASVLLYVARWDALQVYVSPRYVYASGSSESTFVSTTNPTSTTSSSAHQIGGSLGVEYHFGARFGVFGETGVSYARQRSEFSNANFSEQKSRTTGLRSGVGVMLYF